jgi:hypothetical protein
MDEVLRQLAAMRAEFKGELGEVKAGLAAVDGKFDANSSSLQQINSWREGVDAQVVDLTASLDAIRKQVDRVVVGVGLSALGTTRAQHHGSRAPGKPATAKNSSPGARQWSNRLFHCPPRSQVPKTPTNPYLLFLFRRINLLR